jgi:hypothetical protein
VGLLIFRDACRVEWRVCEVTRAQLEASRAEREREAVAPGAPLGTASRRVLPGLEGGWLSFESWREKRRLTVYPADWQDLPPAELERLCAQATPVPERDGAFRPRGPDSPTA